MFGVPNEVMALLAMAGPSRAFADWLAAGGVPPAPNVGVPVLAPADTRPASIADWAPWVTGAYSAVLQDRPPIVMQWLARTDPSELRDAVRGSIAAVGLEPAELPLPPGLLPMSIAACAPPGATDKTGRLVVVAYGVSSGGAGTILCALIRP